MIKDGVILTNCAQKQYFKILTKFIYKSNKQRTRVGAAMLRKLLLFTTILTIICNPILSAYSNEEPQCTPIEKVAIDMGYKVSKLQNEALELIKDGRYIYAEIDSNFCSVTLVSMIDKVNTENINFLQSWNNKKGLIGKGVYSEKNIYFEQTMLLANAPEELVAMQIIVYEVEVQKFYQSIKKVNKLNI